MLNSKMVSKSTYLNMSAQQEALLASGGQVDFLLTVQVWFMKAQEYFLFFMYNEFQWHQLICKILLILALSIYCEEVQLIGFDQAGGAFNPECSIQGTQLTLTTAGVSSTFTVTVTMIGVENQLILTGAHPRLCSEPMKSTGERQVYESHCRSSQLTILEQPWSCFAFKFLLRHSVWAHCTRCNFLPNAGGSDINALLTSTADWSVIPSQVIEICLPK